MESEDEALVMRTLTEDDLPAFQHFWVDELGFFMSKNLIYRWYLTDPEGFFGVFLDNRLIASGSAVKQTKNLYFIGSIGVTSSHRRKGFCKKIFSRLFERCQGDNFALFAEPASVPMYLRLGFKVVENEMAYVYSGKAASLSRSREDSSLEFKVVDSRETDLIQDLVGYDARIHGFERPIATVLLEDDDSSVVACLRDGSIVGYVRLATHRRDGGAFVCPLYADDSEVASRLLEDVFHRNKARAEISVFMFASSRGRFLAEQLQLKKKKDAPMCCTSPEKLPEMQVEKIFGFDSINFTCR